MEALEIDVSIATERYMIGRELAQASAVDPVAALRVLKLLLSGREQSGMVSYDLTRHAVPVVLAAAMQSQDPVVAGEAEAYMHELGRRGTSRWLRRGSGAPW